MAEAKGSRSLVLDGITHRYPGGAIAVENINLDVKGGEIIALLGPSGCGKTTLLRIVAGFIAQTQGRIIIGDEIVDALPPNRRAVGIVFQNYALFPPDIAENVARLVRARRRNAGAIAPVISSSFPDGRAFAAQLSGGQQHAWHWRVHSRSNRRSSCSMNPLRHSTRTCGSTCRSRSNVCNAYPELQR